MCMLKRHMSRKYGRHSQAWLKRSSENMPKNAEHYLILFDLINISANHVLLGDCRETPQIQLPESRV